MMHYARAFYGIVWRELLRFLQQRERLLAALVRPLIWLIIFAAGFRAALGISIIPPYETYITYDVYITPGLLAMIQLFQGMQSSLSMVYDREMGSMRVLLTTPLPRWFPGAHIDIHLPSGRLRQYSLCGDPGRRDVYRIAVRRIVDGGGGSIEVHDTLPVGATVTTNSLAATALIRLGKLLGGRARDAR